MKNAMAFINIKKIIILFILLFLEKNSIKAQVLSYTNSTANSFDTASNLKYFNTLDKQIQLKLDSFYLLINERNKINRKGIKYYNTDSGFVTADFYRDNKTKKLNILLRLNNTYVDYLLAINKPEDYQNLFGFTFYKSKLVLLNLSYSKHKVKDEFASLVKDLIFPELTYNVKKEILKNSQKYDVITDGRIYKKYYIIE